MRVKGYAPAASVLPPACKAVHIGLRQRFAAVGLFSPYPSPVLRLFSLSDRHRKRLSCRAWGGQLFPVLLAPLPPLGVVGCPCVRGSVVKVRAASPPFGVVCPASPPQRGASRSYLLRLHYSKRHSPVQAEIFGS